MRPVSFFLLRFMRPVAAFPTFNFIRRKPPFSAPCLFCKLFSILFHSIFCISFSVCAAIFIRGPGDTRSAITPLSRPAKLISVACPVDSDFCPRRISLHIVFPFFKKILRPPLSPSAPFLSTKKDSEFIRAFFIFILFPLILFTKIATSTNGRLFIPPIKTGIFYRA